MCDAGVILIKSTRFPGCFKATSYIMYCCDQKGHDSVVSVTLPFRICIHGADPVVVHHTLLWLWGCDPLHILYFHHVFLKHRQTHRGINIKLCVPRQSMCLKSHQTLVSYVNLYFPTIQK